MSNFLFVSTPAEGHFYPLQPIAKTLISKGHEVAWATGSKFKERIEQIGAIYKRIPAAWDPGEEELYNFFPKLKELKGIPQLKYLVKDIFLECSVDVNNTLDEILKDFPADMLVGDRAIYMTFFKSELTGIPSVMIGLIPLTIVSKDTAPYGLGLLPGNSLFQKLKFRTLNFLVHHIIFRDINNRANLIRKELGLPGFKKPFFRSLFETPTLLLQTTASSFEYPRRDLPGNIRFIGPMFLEPDPDYQFPPWWDELKDERPVVLINQGTMGMNINNLILPAIEGLKNENLLIIAVPGPNNDIPDLPANVHLEKFIPFDQLLPHVDVMVTNGGYGGTQMALAHGIPLLMAGVTEDKMEVAARVEWVGAGINLRKKQPTPEEIKTSVNEIFSNPAYRANAKKIKSDFAKYDAPTLAVELIEELTEKTSKLVIA